MSENAALAELVPGHGDPRDPNHHLWRNGRVWWIAFTVHVDGWRVERVRHSLGTADVVEARRRRDAVLRDWSSRPGHALALRFDGARRKGARVATPVDAHALQSVLVQ